MKRRIFDLLKTIILSIMISLSLANTCYAEVNPEDLQGYLNGVVAQQKINQSNNPKYAERTDAVEMIDPMTGNLQLKETDITLPGKDGLDLNIGRVYNSSQDEFTHKVKVNIYSYSLPPRLVTGYLIHVYFMDGSQFSVGPYLSSEEAYSLYVMYSSWSDVSSVNVTYESVIVYEFGHDVIVTDYIDKFNYNETRYNLGAGWSFAFPSVQIYRDNVDDTQFIYYYDGTGSSYRVTGTTDIGKSNLEGYQGNDVKFLEDNGSYVNGDNVASEYKFIASDLTTTYFAADGRLLGIKDRFNNEIKSGIKITRSTVLHIL